MLSLTPYRRNTIARNDDVVDLYNMVDRFFNGVQKPFSELEKTTFKVDVRENDDEFLIDAELAGFTKDEVCIDLDDGTLYISAEKKEEKNEETDKYLHRERSFTSMKRGVFLPSVDEEGIKANFEDGVLKIKVPKRKKDEKKKQIEIE